VRYVRLSVVSVKFVYCVENSKYILNILSPLSRTALFGTKYGHYSVIFLYIYGHVTASYKLSYYYYFLNNIIIIIIIKRYGNIPI